MSDKQFLIQPNIGNNIKKIREIKNLTQEYIAEELSISRQTYMMIENGQKDIKFGCLNQIAAIMNITINDIILYNNKLISRTLPPPPPHNILKILIQ